METLGTEARCDLCTDLVSGRACVPTDVGLLSNRRSISLKQRMRLPSCSVLSLLGLPVLRRQHPVPESLRARRQTGLEAAAGSAGCSSRSAGYSRRFWEDEDFPVPLGGGLPGLCPPLLFGKCAQALFNSGLYFLRQDGPSSSLACRSSRTGTVVFIHRLIPMHSAGT